MISPLFVPIQGRTQDEIQSGQVREFIGDGTPYLRVPGLTQLYSLRTNQAEMPLFIRQSFPQAAPFEQKVTADWPLFTLTIDPETETPVLLRSIQSNDGIWQKGERFFVRGEWETTPEPADIPAKKSKES